MEIAEQIKVLIKLQELDLKIFALKRELDAKPREMKQLDEEFEAFKAAAKQKEEELKNLQVKVKEKEVDLEEKENTIKKYQVQLYQIKTNKEYKSLEKEIEGVKADKAVLEEEIITMFERVDEANKNKAKEKEILKNNESELAEKKKLIEQRIAESKAEIGKLEAARTELVKSIDKGILGKYERILYKKDGLAMTPVDGDACQGCHMNLPPQVINEIRLKKELVFCESCARILYIDESKGG